MTPDPLRTREILDAYYNGTITEAQMREQLRENHFEPIVIDHILEEMQDDVLPLDPADQ